VISPCVTFNNHEGSTKSYDWGRDHEGPVHEIGFVAAWDHPDVGDAAEQVIEVPMPGGGTIRVRRVGEAHDPRDKPAAYALLRKAHGDQEFVTGLFYIDTEEPSLQTRLELVDEPLATLPDARVRPPREALEEINEALR
jgi:2-oxoglutarate ferredoxin oxidoreductase subunit beta